MADEKVIAHLQRLLDTARADHSRALKKLRQAEAEVESLRLEVNEHEESARYTAAAIDEMNRKDGSDSRISQPLDNPKPTRIEYDLSERSEEATHPSNVQDFSSRGNHGGQAVAYIRQPRISPQIQADFEPLSTRFSDRTITQSCTLLLREAGRPLHVNDLFNRLKEGGMKFKGNNPTISVAVSLSRNTRFEKVAPGTFDLLIRDAHRKAS